MIKLDDTFIKTVKSRDTSSIEAVAEIYGNLVFSLAQSIVKDREKALDITCEVFALLYRSHNGFSNAKNIENEIFFTCRRLCLGSHTFSVKHTENPSLRALNFLPVKYGSVLILSDVYSLTLDQIATLWGISEQKASKRLTTARMMICKFIKKQTSE